MKCSFFDLIYRSFYEVSVINECTRKPDGMTVFDMLVALYSHSAVFLALFCSAVGLVEFVPNAIALGEYLSRAHRVSQPDRVSHHYVFL